VNPSLILRILLVTKLSGFVDLECPRALSEDGEQAGRLHGAGTNPTHPPHEYFVPPRAGQPEEIHESEDLLDKSSCAPVAKCQMSIATVGWATGGRRTNERRKQGSSPQPSKRRAAVGRTRPGAGGRAGGRPGHARTRPTSPPTSARTAHTTHTLAAPPKEPNRLFFQKPKPPIPSPPPPPRDPVSSLLAPARRPPPPTPMGSGEEPSQMRRALVDSLAGAISGGISRTVTSPLDVIKIRFQVPPLTSFSSRLHLPGGILPAGASGRCSIGGLI
jgi:hypothetical protein